VTPERFPAAVYAETVLSHNFSEAKKHFLESLLEIHHAHTRMLAKQGILKQHEAANLIEGLHTLDRKRIESAKYDGLDEDLFFFVERMIEESLGCELAGKMHTARSRNDIAITSYRMTARREILDLLQAEAGLRGTLLEWAARHCHTLMPAHTHGQPAQPTTLAHYVLAAVEFLSRDIERMQSAFARVNVSPMGAAAITTTGFPIDREETARLLGFEGLAENSYGAIASIDYITEAAAAVAVAMINLGKLTHDLLLWSSREFAFLRLSDGFVQSSSIMPQKRNPVALEHVRILASRAMGQAQAVLACAHNTPFGDINDGEDNLQPLVFAMFSDACRGIKLLEGIVRTTEVNCATMAERAGRDFLTVTELADTLVRREGLSFREAHRMVSEAVRACGAQDDGDTIATMLKTQNPGLRLTADEIRQALDPANFVRVRAVIGGPAPERTADAIQSFLTAQKNIERWLSSKRELLDSARSALLRRL
jgi:argininosuccinate lyase